MAASLPVPPPLAMPFANIGDKNTIPILNSGGGASLTEGFPPITAVPISAGGIPPSREDMNGMAYVATFPEYFLQMGGYYTFDENVASAIQGYPLGAVLTYYDSGARVVRQLRSTKPNNYDNFIVSSAYIGQSWQDVTPVEVTGRQYFDIFFALTTEAPFGAVPLDGRTLSKDDYPGFYAEAVSRKAAGTIPTATIAEYSAAISTYGQCGSFVVDEAAETVRVPTITAFVQAGTPGTIHSAGLPNISGYFGGNVDDGVFNGAFYDKNVYAWGNNGMEGGGQIGFDASRSNATYGKSDTVQPKSVEAKLYIQVIEGNVSGGEGITADEAIEVISSAGGMFENQPISTTVGQCELNLTSSGFSASAGQCEQILSSGAWGLSAGLCGLTFTSGGFVVDCGDGKWTFGLNSSSRPYVSYEDQTVGSASINFTTDSGSLHISSVLGTEQTITITSGGVALDGVPFMLQLVDVVNTSATSASFAPEPGKRYTFKQSLTALTVTSVAASEKQTEIVFTAGSGIAVDLPGDLDVMPVGGVVYTSGGHYIINIANGLAIIGEYTPGA